MNFSKALRLMREGKPVRRKSWENVEFCIFLHESYPYQIAGKGQIPSSAIFSNMDIMATDWEVYGEEFKKFDNPALVAKAAAIIIDKETRDFVANNFAWAISECVKKRLVRRKAWDPRLHLALDDNNAIYLFRRNSPSAQMYVINLIDATANDWTSFEPA